MDITGVDLTDPNTCFQSPLSLRYASPEMKYLYSDQFKFQTWREMWVILAKAQLKLQFGQKCWPDYLNLVIFKVLGVKFSAKNRDFLNCLIGSPCGSFYGKNLTPKTS